MLNRQAVIDALDECEWAFAPNDKGACAELAERIARTGRLGTNLISYSNLVAGVSFNLPTVNGGAPYQIDTHNWEGLDRRIIGDFLGYISAASYKAGDFMATALVVGLANNQPSDIFFEWMHELNVLPSLTNASIEKFWVEQVSKAVAWYQANPNGFEV